ncbi:MAG: hypothetical protein UU70_C0018G0001, partial [Candidatus Yanofskybacteria bacterium GW2011_GWA1_41_6]
MYVYSIIDSLIFTKKRKSWVKIAYIYTNIIHLSILKPYLNGDFYL